MCVSFFFFFFFQAEDGIRDLTVTRVQTCALPISETGERLKSDPQWRYEPKLDGYRVIAFVDGASVRLQSRRGLDLTPHFPELAADLTVQGSGRMILDGEIVALDGEGHPS